MASSSRKKKKGPKMLIHGVDCKAPNFKLSLAITKVLNLASANSQIPSKVLLICDIHYFYHYST